MSKPTLLLVLASSWPALVDATRAASIRELLQRHSPSNVVPMTSPDGLVGLACMQDCKAGDVLLEVPISACLGEPGDDAIEHADGAIARGVPFQQPPEWANDLPWIARLAVLVLKASSSGDLFLRSWPSAEVELPMCLEPNVLRHHSHDDGAFAEEALFLRSWVAEQLACARTAAAAAGDDADPWSEAAWRWAVTHVGARVLNVDTGAATGFGECRLLVPCVDLANHAARPSAIYAFSRSSPCGAAVRLVATRDLRAGDEVTLEYGRRTNAHFAQCAPPRRPRAATPPLPPCPARPRPVLIGPCGAAPS